MQLDGLMTTLPSNMSLWMAPVGHPIMQIGSVQCMHACATMMLLWTGPCRRKRGLLSWVAAHARTQSSHRVQWSRSITIVSVPLKNLFWVTNSIISAVTLESADPVPAGEGARLRGPVLTSGGSADSGIAGSTNFSMTEAGITRT